MQIETRDSANSGLVIRS